ncbi:hypothetical protein E3C22_10520 [Jiella endophytica]|uniref:Lipocalin-like domain-containing protein n=1 Tax=Jiella endophytica TaxID=2558362 RepID=A0A4Y8RIN1_9HYPH|nr:hypothetical protein [Jiella endophytica]TFF22885.1 hypothetical protein E3C22_10520 [Jiella endophytica]
MSREPNWPLVGKWRILSTEMWDRAALDECGPAYFLFGERQGEARLIVMELSLDCGFSKTMVHFDFSGSDEGMEVAGDGFAELREDGVIEGEISFTEGDECAFVARRWRDEDDG